MVKTKVCNICFIEKEIDKFHKQKSGKYGVRPECKDCRKIQKHIYYLKNKEKIDKRNKQNRIKNIDNYRTINRLYYSQNKSKFQTYNMLNKDKIKLRMKQWREKNKLYLSQYDKQYKILHRKYINTRNKNRRKKDVNFKLRAYLGTCISVALNKNWKTGRTLNLLGCNIQFLKTYLESKFKEGMSWENYGSGRNGKGMQEWHIDHIIPISSFDLSDSKQQEECFNYKNLQPLWAKENLEKSDKLVRNE